MGLDGVGQFGESWRPDVTGDPNTGGSRERFFDITAYTLPADGTLGNAKKGSLKGPGTWIANFAFYKDVFRTAGGTQVEFTAMLDNAFNHPQFFVPGLGYRGIRGPDLVPAGRPGGQRQRQRCSAGDNVGNAEGFAAGRVIRLGLRLRF